MQPDEFADIVVPIIKAAQAPLLERLASGDARIEALQAQVATLDAKWNDIGVLRERVALVEARPMPAPLVSLETRLAVTEAQFAALDRRVQDDALTKELGALRERVAVVEVRPSVPGPQGEPGQPGKDGADGTAGLSFEGVYQDGKSYDLGNLVTWAGSSWHCNEATTTKPGDGSRAWTLMVKRGRDGKDGASGVDGKPGRDLTKEAAWRS